ncbi:MAG: hypothetical protein CMH48_02880 [Muricauda sp.]|nr:hypothetical protein [Allomuricauda sp.]
MVVRKETVLYYWVTVYSLWGQKQKKYHTEKGDKLTRHMALKNFNKTLFNFLKKRLNIFILLTCCG